jgi:uncharacterized protein YerC
MPHVSKSRLNISSEKKIIETFNLVLASIHKDIEMEGFLNSILSPTEIVMLSKRLAIVLLLNENIPASVIASSLHVTRETVARIALLQQLRGDGYKTAIGKIEKNKNLEMFKKSLLELTKYTIRAAGGYVKA